MSLVTSSPCKTVIKQKLYLSLYEINPSESSQFDDIITGLSFDLKYFLSDNRMYHFLNLDQSLPPIKLILYGIFLSKIGVSIPPCFLTKIFTFNSLCLPRCSANSNDQEAIPPLFEGLNSSVIMAISLMTIPIINLAI